MITLQPIIKPVSLACNLGCRYCYYGPPRKEDFRERLGQAVDKLTVMTDDTLTSLIKEFGECDPLPSFIWHGGEPLLAGLDFFQRVVNLQRKEYKNRQFRNILQTNGTLVTTDWAEFFFENHFQIGVSFDGIPSSHDALRVHQGGSGSALETTRGIRLLQESKINPSIICTVTTTNVESPRDIYQYLRSLGITQMQFNHLHERERLGDRSRVAVDPNEYMDFLTEIFHIWIEEDNPEVEIAEIHSLIQILTGGSEKGCIFSGICDRYLTVEHDGSISWCDTIGKPQEVRVFGNITDGLSKIVTSESFQIFQQQLEDLKKRSRAEPWARYISFGCLGDYADLPLGNDSAHNSVAPSWTKLIQTIKARLIQHGFALSEPT